MQTCWPAGVGAAARQGALGRRRRCAKCAGAAWKGLLLPATHCACWHTAAAAAVRACQAGRVAIVQLYCLELYCLHLYCLPAGTMWRTCAALLSRRKPSSSSCGVWGSSGARKPFPLQTTSSGGPSSSRWGVMSGNSRAFRVHSACVLHAFCMHEAAAAAACWAARVWLRSSRPGCWHLPRKPG